MLNTKSFLTVDFGAGSLKLAEFEVNEVGGLLLKQYSITPLGAVNDFQAVTNRDAVTCRHAILAMLHLTTNFVPWVAQEFANTLRDQQDQRFGPLICRNIGWTRHFTSPDIRRQVMKTHALNHLRQNI